MAKNPLHYQLSEYDCGPTAILDAISYLFPREEIPPEIIRNVMLYCLDCYNTEGCPGKSGTSHMEYNRIVPVELFNTTELKLYAFGPVEEREAVLLGNKNTLLTAEKTIESFI